MIRIGVFDGLRIPAESLYNSTCSVCGYITERDEETGIDGIKEKELYTNIPCRISYKNIPSAEQTETGAALKQVIKLFCRPDIEIPAGSRIICGGVSYRAAGQAALYASHQEIELTLEREWA